MGTLVWQTWGFSVIWRDEERRDALLPWHIAYRAALAAKREHPEREACGYVTSDSHATSMVIVPNVNAEPGRFAFSNDVVWDVYNHIEAQSLGGLWHSHPMGHTQPSDEDWAGQPRDVPLYLVVLLDDNVCEVWHYDDSDRP